MLNGTRSTCFTSNHRWGECDCQTEVPEEEGFTFEGTTIVDPSISVEGMCFVEPTEYYGQAYIEWKNKR